MASWDNLEVRGFVFYYFPGYIPPPQPAPSGDGEGKAEKNTSDYAAGDRLKSKASGVVVEVTKVAGDSIDIRTVVGHAEATVKAKDLNGWDKVK